MILKNILLRIQQLDTQHNLLSKLNKELWN